MKKIEEEALKNPDLLAAKVKEEEAKAYNPMSMTGGPAGISAAGGDPGSLGAIGGPSMLGGNYGNMGASLGGPAT